MKTIFNLNVEDKIFVKNKAYLITKKDNFLQNNSKAVSYTITNKKEVLVVEIKREFTLNYQIFLYKKVETLPFEVSFLSILGTNTLGFKNKKVSKNNIYTKINLKSQKYDLVKHIVDKEELPEDYLSKGYHLDEYGEWYFYTKRYEPTIRVTKQTKEQVWEYKQNGNIRLLISTDLNQKSKIDIFKGEELWQSDVTTSKTLKTSPQAQKNQRLSTLY